MTYLLDVNVWTALAAQRHIHHEIAKRWFGTIQNQRLAFCRLTQLGFLRLLTNKHVMQDEVLAPEGAWRAYRKLRSDRRIDYLAEPRELAETWEGFTGAGLSSPNLWTDAYLCAFAAAAGLTLVTFDTKIPKSGGVVCLVLGASPEAGPSS